MSMTDFCDINNASSFANCLKDLSVSELLRLQHSLDQLPDEEFMENRHVNKTNTECVGEECDKQTDTMALMAERRDYEPSSYYPETSYGSYGSYHPVEAKPSKLQTLFQISITALAFLSFGGYLLCLIVQSIKSKGTTFLHSVPSSTAATNGVKRIKVYRRNRRSSLPPIDVVPGYSSMNSNYDYNYQQHPANPYQYN